MEKLKRAVNRISSFDVYCGTTLGNFITCTSKSEEQIYYDKSREGKHKHQEFYWALQFRRAESYATPLAEYLNQVPLIMQGRIPISHLLEALGHFEGKMPEGYLFPVKKIWVPKEGMDWRTQYKNEYSIREILEEKDPKEFLIQLSN